MVTSGMPKAELIKLSASSRPRKPVKTTEEATRRLMEAANRGGLNNALRIKKDKVKAKEEIKKVKRYV